MFRVKGLGFRGLGFRVAELCEHKCAGSVIPQPFFSVRELRVERQGLTGLTKWNLRLFLPGGSPLPLRFKLPTPRRLKLLIVVYLNSLRGLYKGLDRGLLQRLSGISNVTGWEPTCLSP